MSLSAGAVGRAIDPTMTAAMTATGGGLIVGIGLRLLEIKEVRVGNLLPALVLAPVAVVLVQRLL